MSINTAISLIGDMYTGQYYAIFSGTQIRVFTGCPPRSTTSQSRDYIAYDYSYGIPVTEGSQNINQNTYTLNSVDCSSDSGPHGSIVIDNNPLRVLAYIPYVPFYLMASIVAFIFVFRFIFKLFFGWRHYG